MNDLNFDDPDQYSVNAIDDNPLIDDAEVSLVVRLDPVYDTNSEFNSSALNTRDVS